MCRVDSMNDAFAFVVCSALGLALLPSVMRAEPVEIRRLAAWSFTAHLAASLAQIWITLRVYGGGDMFGYYRLGLELSRLLQYRFGFFAPEVLNLVLQADPMLPLQVQAGTPTGTMVGIAGFLLFGLGDSLYGCVALISLTAFFGKLALFRALTNDWDDSLRKPIFIGVMLLPSIVFWSAGLLKESVIIGPLGWMYAGFRRLVIHRHLPSIPVVAVSALLIALVKPYVLFAVVAAIGAFLYGEHARRAGRHAVVRPLPLAFAAAVAVAGVIGLGQIFPEFALDHVAEHTANQQLVGQRVRGGSSYSIGDPTQRSIGGQLAFTPIAIVSSLFRPFIFEARNPQIAVNALEMFAVLLLTIRAVSKRSWVALWQDVQRSPMLMFCVAFTLAFALPVGLATTNLGTLSRYRMPLLPFFAAVLMVWNADLFRERRR